MFFKLSIAFKRLCTLIFKSVYSKIWKTIISNSTFTFRSKRLKTFIKLLSFSQDELIKVTNEKRMLGEQLKDFRDSNRAHLAIENKRLQDNLQNQKTEHEQNQKWLKSQNDTLMRKQQVNLDPVSTLPKPFFRIWIEKMPT